MRFAIDHGQSREEYCSVGRRRHLTNAAPVTGRSSSPLKMPRASYQPAELVTAQCLIEGERFTGGDENVVRSLPETFPDVCDATGNGTGEIGTAFRYEGELAQILSGFVDDGSALRSSVSVTTDAPSSRTSLSDVAIFGASKTYPGFAG